MKQYEYKYAGAGKIGIKISELQELGKEGWLAVAGNIDYQGEWFRGLLVREIEKELCPDNLDERARSVYFSNQSGKYGTNTPFEVSPPFPSYHSESQQTPYGQTAPRYWVKKGEIDITVQVPARTDSFFPEKETGEAERGMYEDPHR